MDRPERLVVVLGYSDGGAGALHPVCRARLEHAARIAGPEDVVVLSGWARVRRAPSEASLMRTAWAGRAGSLVVDEDARTTAENAVNALADVLRERPREVVVVTSSWHARRAAAAFARALAGTGAAVRVDSPPGRGRRRERLRELALRPLLPFQVRRALRRRPGR